MEHKDETANRPVLKAVSIGKKVTSPEGLLTILDGVSLEIALGESVAIVGQSGAGFKRVRMGVGHPGKEKMLSHVLDDFSSSETAWVETLCDAVARATPLLLENKHDAFQTKVSTLAPAPPIPAWLRGGEKADG